MSRAGIRTGRLVSWVTGEDTDKTIFWNNRTVWNNDGDTASLFNERGLLVAEKDCPSITVRNSGTRSLGYTAPRGR